MIDLEGVAILVVEDEPALCELIEAAITSAGGTVVGPASDIASAFTLIAEEDFSAAILDLIVHGEHADALAIELARRGVPFAVTTGIGADLDHPELRQALTITKPFQAEYVQEVIQTLLSRSRSNTSHKG